MQDTIFVNTLKILLDYLNVDATDPDGPSKVPVASAPEGITQSL